MGVGKNIEHNTFAHIFNRGVEGLEIFKDGDDYETFTSFLEEYLSTPPDPTTVKQQFTVKGRTYHGTPHMPKNYYNSVELVAYSLMPDHFHLILHQISKDAQTKFLRSLGTRYSMYYNKKYGRRGSLFAGSYKSAELQDGSLLPSLVRYIYTHNGDETSRYSSYPEHISSGTKSWIKADYVLSLEPNFKRYIDRQDNKLESLSEIKDILFETVSTAKSVLAPSDEEVKDSEVLEGSDLSSNHPLRVKNRKLRATSFSFATIGAFALLFTMGLRNVQHSSAQAGIAEVSPQTEVASAATEHTETDPNPTPEPTMVVITIEDNAKSVNIRQLPSTNSEILLKAEAGEKFIYIDEGDNWYHLSLNDNKEAYVSKKYAILQGGEQE